MGDFGCSKRSIETMSRTMKGSIPWMAPEVIQHAGYGRAADIWSLGCVIVEMATAKRPWGRFDNQMAACVKIAMSEETPPVPEHLSVVLRDLLECCLRRDPIVRLSATELMLHDFVKVLTEDAPERLGIQEYVATAPPNYSTIKELLPGFLE